MLISNFPLAFTFDIPKWYKIMSSIPFKYFLIRLITLFQLSLCAASSRVTGFDIILPEIIKHLPRNNMRLMMPLSHDLKIGKEPIIKIITWFRNLSTPSTSLKFGHFDTTKEFKSRIYMLHLLLWCQTALALIRVLVDQSALFLMGASKTMKFHRYREKLQHHLFMIGLRDDFESNHNQLFHCTPLPTIGQVLNKIVLKETRLHSLHSQHP